MLGNPRLFQNSSNPGVWLDSMMGGGAEATGSVGSSSDSETVETTLKKFNHTCMWKYKINLEELSNPLAKKKKILMSLTSYTFS